MKRVLQISNYQYPHIGGIEQVARDIADALSEIDGIEQKMICFNEDAGDGDYICHRKETVHDEVDGIEVIRCGCITKVASQSISMTYNRELKRVFNEFQPDIVIFHYPNPFVAHFLLKYKKRDFKLALYWHLDITKQKTMKKLFHGQNLALIRRADYILGATPIHLNQSGFSAEFGDKKYVLPYMIDERKLVLSEEEKREAELLREKHKGEKIGFFIGRHVPYKGLKYLVEASAKLTETKIHFYIAGQGELTDELKKLAKDDPKIEFVGRISDSQRRIFQQACDIVCFPSITRNEAFGLALAEGMYFGKPAVTFHIDGSGVNYVNLDGVTGIECSNGDTGAYAAALDKLCADRELYEEYGKNARQRVLDNFTVESFKTNVKKFIMTA